MNETTEMIDPMRAPHRTYLAAMRKSERHRIACPDGCDQEYLTDKRCALGRKLFAKQVKAWAPVEALLPEIDRRLQEAQSR